MLFKNAKSISEKEINQYYNDLFGSCEKDLRKLKSILEHQKNRDEQERLRKIQEDLELALKQKQEEENLKRLEEEQRKQ